MTSVPEAYPGAPARWGQARLEEIASIVRGVSFPKTAKSEEPEPGRVACLRTGNVQQEVTWGKLWFVPESVVKRDEQFLQAGDILISTSNSYELVGKVAQVTGLPIKATLGAFISAIRAKPEIDPRFLYFQLASSHQQSQLRGMASTTTNISNVSTKKLKQLVLQIASLPEQHRIVEALETHFTRLDAAVEILQRVQANLKRYRASVLKAAVEGRLVPTEAELARREGRDYEPASVLLERILEERRRRWEEAELAKMRAKGKEPRNGKWKAKYKEPVAPDSSGLPELPEGWCWASVALLSERIQYGLTAKAVHSPVGPRFLRITDIQEHGVDWTKVPTCSGVQKDLSDYRLQSGDLVFARTGATTGKSFLVRTCPRESVFASFLIRIRFVAGVEPCYLAAFFQSGGYWRQIVSKSSGIAQPGVNAAKLRTVVVPLPPQREQERIAAKVEDLLSMVDVAASEIESDVLRCARLRQSILKWAFEGKLVDQDPNDEPASVLLERIRAKREQTPQSDRRTRKKRARGGSRQQQLDLT